MHKFKVGDLVTIADFEALKESRLFVGDNKNYPMGQTAGRIGEIVNISASGNYLVDVKVESGKNYRFFYEGAYLSLPSEGIQCDVNKLLDFLNQ